MKRLAARLAPILLSLGLAVTSIFAPPTPNGVQAVQARMPARTQAQSTQLMILRVFLAQPGDAARVLGLGVDVLEARERNALLVLGDKEVVQELRAKGFVVEVAQRLEQPARSPFTYFGGYHTVAEHEQHLADVAAAYPALAKVVSYGVSWQRQQNPLEGHELKAICITKLRASDCALNPNTDKPRFFLMAAIHARELTTGELAWRWIDWLTQGYGVDAEITALLDSSEMWVVPLSNPDGRARVEQGVNLPLSQRKNLHVAPSGSCGETSANIYVNNQDGVDLNRNADFKWGESGSTTNPCDLLYRGASAGSEPEEQALETLMRNLFVDQRPDDDTTTAPITTTGAMLSLHTYSNLVLIPWGWVECLHAACPANQQAPNEPGLRAFGFRLSYYNGYDTGQPSEVLYAASGTTDDWAYGRLGIAAGTFEIGPQFGPCTGFTPPFSCQEDLFWPLNKGAFLSAAKLARQPYSLSLGPSVLSATVEITYASPFSSTPAPREALTATIRARASDDAFGNSLDSVGRPATQAISATELYIDTPPWAGGSPLPLAPSDGQLDGVTEDMQVKLPLSDVAVGKHLLYVRAQDSSGAWGPTTSAWLDSTPVITPSVHLYHFPIIEK